MFWSGLCAWVCCVGGWPLAMYGFALLTVVANLLTVFVVVFVMLSCISSYMLSAWN